MKEVNTIQCLVLGVCFLVSAMPITAQGEESEVDVQELQEKYDRVRSQTEELEAEQTEKQKIIKEFQSQIEELNGDIEQTSTDLERIKEELKGTKERIGKLQKEINAQKRMIKEYLATLYSEDDISMLRMLLSNENLSEMVTAVENVNAIQTSLKERIRIVQKNQRDIRRAKKDLFQKERQLEKEKRNLQRQKNLKKQTKQRKEQALTRINKDLKSRREKKRKLAARINAFTSAQGEAVSIKKAYDQAERISTALNEKISPEFLVGMLMVESGTSGVVGENFGNTHYKDALIGCLGEKLGKRHITSFRKIMNSLGMSPDKRLLSSCGAMGYAQFLPATWMGWVPSIKKYQTGDGFPNPWELEDAMLAAAVKLTNANPSIKEGDDLTQNHGLRRRRALQYYGSQNETWYADRVMSSMEQVRRLMGDAQDEKSSKEKEKDPSDTSEKEE